MNKRMVAGYYLFLCLVGFAVLLGPTGALIPINIIGTDGRYQHEIATPTGTDPSACSGCHADQFGNWSLTAHATHMSVVNSTHYSIGSRLVTQTLFNSSCGACHSSGYDPDTDSFDNLGINCFACHNTTAPYVDYSGEACAPCHTGSSPAHPYQYAPWENSAHANSLTDLRTSDHAGASCMHCMSTEGFIDMEAELDPEGDFNAVSCPACHAVHGEWSDEGPYMIRAENASELCANCHTGSRHGAYDTWIGGSHHLAGLTCIDCHGYDLTNTSNTDTYFLNHTFVVKPDLACGQPDNGCHEDNEAWALAQLETIQEAYDALVEEIQTEADDLETIVLAYNETAGADTELVSTVMEAIDGANAAIMSTNGDGSSGFHDRVGILDTLNGAYVDLLNAKAYYYENLPGETTAPPGMDLLIIAGGAIGGIVIGLILGLLVGRRR